MADKLTDLRCKWSRVENHIILLFEWIQFIKISIKYIIIFLLLLMI